MDTVAQIGSSDRRVLFRHQTNQGHGWLLVSNGICSNDRWLLFHQAELFAWQAMKTVALVLAKHGNRHGNVWLLAKDVDRHGSGWLLARHRDSRGSGWLLTKHGSSHGNGWLLISNGNSSADRWQ